MTYAIEASKPRSEKVTLATVECVDQAKVFTLDSGSQYYKDVNYYVVGVKQGTTTLAAGTLALAAGQYYFNPLTKRLYIRMTDSSNPNTKQVSITYRLFFGTGEFNLPFNLASGEEVPFDGRIQSIGGLKQSLDDEQVGTVVESSSSISLINQDGFFDDIYDTLIWENQAIEFYSWFPNIPIAQSRKIFSGVIEEKSFTSSVVNFKLKDFTFRLRDKLNLSLFTTSDGDLSDSDLNTYKTRIYGKVKHLKTIGIDKNLDNVSSAITVTTSIGSNILTFSSSILATIFPGDEIFFTLNNTEYKFGVDLITSSTTATTASNIEINLTAQAFFIRPKTPSRNKNRDWHIAGHKLRAPSTTITNVFSGNRFEVASTLDLFAGDLIDVNGDNVLIRRITNNIITTETNVTPTPSVSDTVSREAVNDVFFGNKRLIIDRDWSLTNTTEAILNIDPLAEFNITPERSLVGTNLTFTNGTRNITSSSGTLDLRTILKPRDWVRSSSITHTTWYEISQVNEFSIDIVTTFGGTTGATTALYKNVEYINDDSLITVSTYGMEYLGAWIKTPAQSVKHMLLVDSGFTAIDTASFTKADAMCDYIVSISFGGDLPEIRESINKINKSVFGSLYTNSNFQLSYSILNSTKPESLAAIKDDDILSFDVTSKNSIISAIRVNYRPFIDINTGEETFEVYQESNSFVNRLIGISRDREETIYLFEDDKAKIIAQRIMFFNSLSTSRVRVKAKANMFLTNLNDKVYLNLDRLYKRYGGRDKLKIGIVSSTSKDGFSSEIEFNDLSNIFNRVNCIAPNTAQVYASATRDEIAKNAFILNNNTETPDGTNNEFGCNLIG
jgi:hypothetical protein